MKIDVSENETKIEAFRLEKELFDKKPSFEKHLNLFDKLGEFYQHYVEIMINAGPVEDSLTINGLVLFTQDSEIKEVYKDVNSTYKDLNLLNDELSSAFKHYNHYFPNKRVPEVTTYISGFNYAVAASDSVLGIGLDMYLGNNYKYYNMIGFPQYKTYSMRSEYITPDAIKGWIATEFEFDPIGKDMLAQIIHHGKIMYMMDAILPNTPDSLKIVYSKDQLEWCKNNESNIWAQFIDKQLLFSTNTKEIMSYLNDGPFTPGMPRESPPKVGVWLGWQIVKAYMERKGDVNLENLIQADAKDILKESKYKPRN
ncbi:MAG: hypothetical protein H0V01_03455 [Bacteroidetes bacterium]|nr:hypothetical protein [Bacteroidota bacterium]HET6245556.1 hypothetical protein [Bacteroidia bacterium]